MEDPLYKEFHAYKAQKSSQQSNTPTDASITTEEETDNNLDFPFIANPYQEIIFFLEFSYLKWKDNIRKLMQKYLDTESFAETSYKNRNHYEHILKTSGVWEIQHFTSNQFRITIDHIPQMIQIYAQQQLDVEKQETPSPFQQMARRLKIHQGTVSKTNLLNAYIQAIKDDLLKNYHTVVINDVSMETKATENSDNIEKPEGQQLEDEEEIFEKTMEFFNTLDKTSASGSTPNTLDPKDKGKVTKMMLTDFNKEVANNKISRQTFKKRWSTRNDRP